MSTAESSPEALTPHLPQQPSERGAWLLACTLAAVGLAVLVAVLTGAVGRTAGQAPPAVLVRAATPQAGQTAAAGVLGQLSTPARAIVADPSSAQQGLEQQRLAGAPITHIPRRWMEGFYPIYATAQDRK